MRAIMKMRKTQNKRGWNSLGTSLVEFALTVPIYLLMIFGSLQMMGTVYQLNAMNKALWDGVRSGVTTTAISKGEIKEVMSLNIRKTLGRFRMENLDAVRVSEPEDILKADIGSSLKMFRFNFDFGFKTWVMKAGSFSNYEGKLPPRSQS